jgi:hypothetical protein
MDFRQTIETAYPARSANGLLPFIGATYEKPSRRDFRVGVVGINSYITDADFRDPDKQRWFAEWWSCAGLGKARPETHRFYERAYEEAQKLADAVVHGSSLFHGLSYDADPVTKSGIYATNAIKVYTSDKYKEAAAIPADLLSTHTPTWHAELDAMAQHEVFPHLIVILGERLWESAWMALHPDALPPYKHFSVLEYETVGDDQSPSYHHANRVRVRISEQDQHVLLVRLHHPSAHSKVQKRADWLLEQSDFRQLARM